MRAILTYHSIDPSGSLISIDETTFHRQLRFLSERVPVLPLDELLRAPPDADAVALTFDDGFRNFAATAWPQLRELGLPAALFVVSDRVGGRNEWDEDHATRIPQLPLLGWDELARLAEEGVALGSHTRTHPRLSELDTTRLRDELAGSQQVIAARTGQRPTCFAYPYGDLNPRVVSAVAKFYALACTTELRPLGPEEARLRLPRLDMYYFQKPGALESWGSLQFRGRLRVRRWARSLRQQLAGAAG